ncbi:hypothetical protein [Chryseobacterium sp. SIMBA_029]|uniref:hypothetical protein n=1 Tax=Chryseobacterium sp. SIMBA_029 TaxID=3085772 RepID=UPI003978A26A
MKKKVLKNITLILMAIVSLVIIANYFYPFLDETQSKYSAALIVFLGMFCVMLLNKKNKF